MDPDPGLFQVEGDCAMNAVKRTKPGGKRPLAGQAYELLKEKIITLELAPGMKLEEQLLREMLKLGRTPIREAIKMLISEGLIVSYGTNATYVKDLTLKSAKDLRRMLARMGAVAFDLTNPHDDFSEIVKKLELCHRKMDESIHKGDIESYVISNAEFHKTLAKIADNEFVDDLFARIYAFEARLTFAVALSLGGKQGPEYQKFYEKIQKQHQEFIDCLKNKAVSKMKQIYEEHMLMAQERLSAYFAGHTP
jgi:DNA-binding GntR family transcriptional regulator